MPKTLLLADDSVTIQKVVGISFANEDVRIVTVDNGDDAVTRAKEIRPDIVLADVVMPGKSGYEVCAALKGDPTLAHIPVLLLTGTFETFDEDRAARVGADGHITKPFEAQALVELVSARLANAAAPRAPAPVAAKGAPAAPKAAPAPAAKPAAAAEPEPFDFLEPEPAPAKPARTGTARPVPGDSDDAFAFDAEPLEPIDLETEDDAEIDLGNEATAARTTLLLDEDDGFAHAPTAPPVHAATAPPVRAATAPPVKAAAAPPPRAATAPPVRGGTAPPVSAGTGTGTSGGAGRITAVELDDTSELTRLVLPVAGDTGGPVSAPAAEDDPLAGIDSVAADPFAGSNERPEWDVASDEFTAAFPTDALSERAGAPADTHDDATPPAFAGSLFEDDDAAAEFELTDPAPAAAARPPVAAPVAAPAPAPAASMSAAAAPELSAAMREQLHGTLEKIAWEALGDVSERIVREAVARIEQVAWDVFPRLAETLIREEIRKLKGDA